jgi:hypothetical protein
MWWPSESAAIGIQKTELADYAIKRLIVPTRARHPPVLNCQHRTRCWKYPPGKWDGTSFYDPVR